MKLLRLAPLALAAVFAACSGAPTAPAVSADAPPSFDSEGGHMSGSGNINDDGGGFGSGNLTTTSSDDTTVDSDSTGRTGHMGGSGN